LTVINGDGALEVVAAADGGSTSVTGVSVLLQECVP
jgi:hypothetical protein